MSPSRSGVAEFWDELSETYDPESVEFFRPVARRLVELAEITAGSHVLDVGCGSGAVLAAAADAVGTDGRVVGIDISAGMVERTLGLIRERGLTQAEAIVVDSDVPPVPARSLEAVLSSMAVFLLPDPATALRAYASALRPGGRLAFSTFAGGDVWDRVEAAVRPFTPQLERSGRDQAWFATPQGIEALLSASGFVDVEIRDESQPVAYASAEAWYEWTLTTPLRKLWRATRDTDRDVARAAALARLPAPDAEGRLVVDTAVRYTLARRLDEAAASVHPASTSGSRSRLPPDVRDPSRKACSRYAANATA